MSTKQTLIILLLTLFVISLANTTKAKSLYVISDTGTWETDIPVIQAYQIQDSSLILQTQYECVHPLAISIAIDTESQFLFVTHEEFPQNPGNEIEIVNAKTMQYVDTVIAQGASDLAGIVFDKGKHKVYTVDRRTPNLYVYSWFPRIPQLVLDEQIELEGLIYGAVGGAWGLALNEQNNRLWVTSNETKVRFYNTNDWSHNPNTDYITLSQKAIGIALDLANQYVYTGTAFFDPSPTYYLSQYDLSDGNETTVYIGDGQNGAEVIGIAVDQQTSLVYITTYGDSEDNIKPYPKDRLMVYNSNLQRLWYSGDIGNPAGVAVAGDVSYKPPRFYLKKEDVNEPNSVVPEDYITYEIIYGPNGVDHENVVITDYLSHKVDYENISDPNYDSQKHTYTWEIGTLGAGEPNDSVTLTVKVNEGAEPNGLITNYCEIEGDQYCSFATADTNVGYWQPDSEIIYVDWLSPCSPGTGMSWRFAYRDLQDGLARARDGNQIWVAAGTYKPTEETTRSISFEMIEGVDIYGGFPSGGGPRNPRIYQTILSGDIDNNGDPSNNSYHVVSCGRDGNSVNNAILDGFTITGGNVRLGDDINYRGGGLYAYKSSPTIKNCIFSNNWAVTGGGMCNSDSSNPTIINCIFSGNTTYPDPTVSCGGGMYNRVSSSPTIENCIFSNNSAEKDGGGMCNSESSDPNITNCIFYKNKTTFSSSKGGGINNYNSSPKLVNCTFSENSARPDHYGKGGGMYNYQPSPIVTNCIFWGNFASSDKEIFPTNQTVTYCDVQGGWDGDTNIDDDPCFVNSDANNYHIIPDSPCIDAGDPAFIPNPGETDIDGEPRVSNGRVDIGADEYYWSPADFDKDEIVNFIDYAMFTNAWKSSFGQSDYNDIYDLKDNNSIDYNDLASFCNDWMWVPAWDRSIGSMMMGDGMGQSMGQGMDQTISESLELNEETYLSTPVEQEQPEPLTQQEIEDILNWLDEVWLYPEVQETISEDDWLEFVETVTESLQNELQN